MKYISICDYYETRRPTYRDVYIILNGIMKRIGRSDGINVVLSPEYIYYNEKTHMVKFTVADKYNVSLDTGVKKVFKYMDTTSLYSDESVRKLIKEAERRYKEEGAVKTYEWLEKTGKKSKMFYVIYIIFCIVVMGLFIIYYTSIQPLVFYS